MSDSTSDRGFPGIGRVASGALAPPPGALTVYLSFNAGGFFPQTPAFVALILALVLAARIALADRPLQGFSRPLAIAAGALALYAVWTLASGIWSDAPGRALLEFDRALLYLLALLLFGSVPRRSAHLRRMIEGLALGIAIVGIIGLVTRVLPDVWPVDPNFANNRLSYPLTYWNSLGLLAAIGVILCFHLTSSKGEPPDRACAGPPRRCRCSQPPSTSLFAGRDRGGDHRADRLRGPWPSARAPDRPARRRAHHRDRARGRVRRRPARHPQTRRLRPRSRRGKTLRSSWRSARRRQPSSGRSFLVVDRRLLLPKLPRGSRRGVMAATAAGALCFVVALTLALEDDISRQYDRFVDGRRSRIVGGLPPESHRPGQQRAPG